MSARGRSLRVQVRPATDEFDCPGCGSWKLGVDLIGPGPEDLNRVADTHARGCQSFHLAQLRADVEDQALLLRLRAAHLENTSRDTGEIPFPWVELRAAARQLDDLVAS